MLSLYCNDIENCNGETTNTKTDARRKFRSTNAEQHRKCPRVGGWEKTNKQNHAEQKTHEQEHKDTHRSKETPRMKPPRPDLSKSPKV